MGKTKKNTKSLLYTMNDFNSNDGMLTTVWGPTMWHFLHTMSFNYPVKPTHEQKKNYKEFILQLQNVLPCGKCRENLKKNFKKLPPTDEHFKNRHSFSLYIFRLHELVNKMLKKKSNLTFKIVRERYEHFRSRCSKSLKQKSSSVRKTKKETGCTVPIYGEKSKCLLRIVPLDTKEETLKIDDDCIKRSLFNECKAK